MYQIAFSTPAQVFPDSKSGLGNDLLRGAAAIADHVFGDAHQRRSVYYYVEKRTLPVFRIGRVICARKSRLDQWIAEQEQAAAPSARGQS